MSSLDYAELQGLNIALTRLSLVAIEDRDEEWVIVNQWLNDEITRLKNLKK